MKTAGAWYSGLRGKPRLNAASAASALPIAILLILTAPAFAADRPANLIADDATSAAAPGSAPQSAGTVEIPQAQSAQPPVTVNGVPPPADTGEPPATSGMSGGDSSIKEYEAAQSPAAMPPPHYHSLQEFLNEADDVAPIGLELREDRRQLSDGQPADGLLIVKVHKGSPAAKAGLRPYTTTGHAVLEGATIAAAMVFPPAVLAMAILDQTQVGESYDMIIGVDGRRVTNFIDFEDEVRDVKPGDVIYLSIVRNGKRVQVPVKVPADATSLSY